MGARASEHVASVEYRVSEHVASVSSINDEFGAQIPEGEVGRSSE